MNDLHVHDFCRDAAKAILKLYAKFPQRIILYVEDIAGEDTPDEFGLHSPRFTAGFHTLLWLAETDYIQYSQTIRQEAIEDASLTHRCFTYLCGPDTQAKNALLHEESNSDPSLIRRVDLLRDYLNTKSSDKLTQLVLRFMRESREFK